MAFLDEAVRALLLAQTSITNIIGQRLYPFRAPDNTPLPCVTYQRVSNLRDHVLSGEQAKFCETIFQIDSWVEEATKLSQLRTLAQNIRTTLDDFRGVTSGVDIQAILSENEFDQPFDDVSKIFGVSQRYRIFHRE